MGKKIYLYALFLLALLALDRPATASPRISNFSAQVSRSGVVRLRWRLTPPVKSATFVVERSQNRLFRSLNSVSKITKYTDLTVRKKGVYRYRVIAKAKEKKIAVSKILKVHIKKSPQATATPNATATPTSSPTPSVTSTRTPTPTPTSTSTEKQTQVSMPIQVYTADGKPVTESISFYVNPSLVTNDEIAALYLRIHGLDPKEASLSINDGPWVLLSNQTAMSHPSEARFGGIEGGVLPVKRLYTSAQGIVNGFNTIRFRVNFATNRSMGYQIIDINLKGKQNQNLLPAKTFQWENPDDWKTPYPDAGSIAEGKKLWTTANLKFSPLNSAMMKAKCSDCHVESGYDLAYFAYSNKAIKTRAMFHGLSASQGDQIASYIRSLDVPHPGRPWNPPFQPGPGLDSKDVLYWAAGAGLDAINESTDDGLDEIFKDGINAQAIDPEKTLNVRELSVGMQYLDWNHWLPTTFPSDAFGAAFDNSVFRKRWDGTGPAEIRNKTILPSLRGPDSEEFIKKDLRLSLTLWSNQDLESTFFATGIQPQKEDPAWNEQLANNLYSVRLWKNVKIWGMYQEYNLYNLGKTYFGDLSEGRGFITETFHLTSPIRAKIAYPIEDNILMKNYAGIAWYEIAKVTTFDRVQRGMYPADWGYTLATLNEMGSHVGDPQRDIFFSVLLKGLQGQHNGVAPGLPDGANPFWKANISEMFKSSQKDFWGGMTQEKKTAILDAFSIAWMKSVNRWTRQDYINGDLVKVDDVYTYYGVKPVDMIGNLILWEEKAGVSPAVAEDLRKTAKRLWPNINWWKIEIPKPQ